MAFIDGAGHVSIPLITGLITDLGLKLLGWPIWCLNPFDYRAHY